MMKTSAVSGKGSINIIYGCAGMMILSFIMAGTTVSGTASPFNAVLAGTLPPAYSTAVLTGSLIFYFFTGNIVDSLAMIGALTMTVVSRWIFDNETPVFKALASLVCMLASSSAVILSAGIEQPSGFAVHICMSVLTSIAVYFFSDVLDSGIKTIQISGSKGCSYAVVCILLITALTSLNIWKFNIGRIFGVFLILSAAAEYRQFGGALCGIFTTCGTMLCSAVTGAATLFFAAAGLITGFFSEFNRIIFGIFFMAVNILGILLIGVTDNSLGMLFDTAAGTLLFWIVPKNALKAYFPDDKNDDINPVRLTSSRIDLTARSLAEIRKDTQNIIKILEKSDCSSADRNIRAAVLKEKQYMLFSQMHLAEEMLSGLCRGMNENIRYDRRNTDIIKHFLNDRKIKYNSAAAYKNSAGRIFIEICCDNIISFDCKSFINEFSEMFLRKFEYSARQMYQGEYIISFSERTSYSVNCFSAQCSACEDEPSGDTAASFEDSFGNTYLVISDGMGSGSLAAVDSKITVSLFRRFITGGIDTLTAVDMVNSIMLSKSSDESFATLDIARINLDTGELTLIKSGASATLIKHDDSVIMVNASTFPVGIINETKPFVKKFSFSKGDSIVMLSDGVSDKSYQYIKTLMLEDDSEQERVPERICDNAKKFFSGRRDDITVLTAKLTAQ